MANDYYQSLLHTMDFYAAYVYYLNIRPSQNINNIVVNHVQVLTPKMQQPIEDTTSEDEQDDMHEKRKDASNHKMAVNSDLEDIKQGTISVEIWKKAFLDSYERLCPVRRLGVEWLLTYA